MKTERGSAAPRTLQLLGVLFVCVVVAVVIHTHQLVIPLFLGLFTWGKVWVKSLTPKLGIFLFKNGTNIQGLRILVQASTHLLVKSHKPWRRGITSLRVTVVQYLKQLFARYLQLPLWLRTTLAVGLLLATAGSSFAVFALLIIPQPVLNWLRQRLTGTLNKLGVTRFFSMLWKLAIPANVRNRWHMHVKWTLGRRQVKAARRLHATILNTTVVDNSTNSLAGPQNRETSGKDSAGTIEEK